MVVTPRPADVSDVAAPPVSGPVGHLRFKEFLRACGWPGIVILIFGVIAVIGPWIAPYDPRAIDAVSLNMGPFHHGHLLGTDDLGRDLLSRVLIGTRPSLLTAIIPIAIASLLGTLVGTVAAFSPKWSGATIMRLLDVAFAFPSIMLAIAIAAMLGPSLSHAMIAITIVLIPPIARVARAAALDVAGKPYIEAARLSGASQRRVVMDFALPNMLPPILIYCAALAGLLIIFGAGLSFLGVGVQPPAAEWGRMVADGRQTLLFNVWASVIPGLCIFIVSVAFNFLADRLRDYMDPHLQ